jgi:hypothetical protein
VDRGLATWHGIRIEETRSSLPSSSLIPAALWWGPLSEGLTSVVGPQDYLSEGTRLVGLQVHSRASGQP